jgi:hypothetical protein
MASAMPSERSGALWVRPRCVASLVFAEHEHSFEPSTLVAQLFQAGVDASLVPDTWHGFMNPGSPHRRADLAHQVQGWIHGACP